VLLTNHRLEAAYVDKAKHLGWCIRSWRELVAFLSHQCLQDGSPLVQAYLAYVKKVCHMVDMQPLRLDSAALYSLVSLHAILDDIIGRASHDDFLYRRDNNKPKFGIEGSAGWSGTYYRVKYKDTTLYPFFGIFFEDPHTMYMSLALEDYWNKEFLH